MSDNELDSLFKEAADGFKVPNDPAAWQDMAGKLDQAGAATASFWNWKTISSTILLGVTVIAVTLYLALPDSKPVADLNSEAIASSDADQAIESEKETTHNKSSDNNPDSGNATPVKKKENDSVIEKESQRISTAVAEEKLLGDEKVEKNKAVQSKNLKESQAQTSQQNNPSPKNSDSSNASSDNRSRGAALTEVALTEKLVATRSSGNVVPSGISSTPNGLNGNDPKNQGNPVTTDFSKVNGNEKAEALSKIVVTEKSLEPKSSAGMVSSETGVVSSESSSNQPASYTKSSKTNTASLAADSMKIAADEKKEKTLSEKDNETEPDERNKENAFNRFALKLAVAPDYSTVKSATPNSLGINYGVLIEYRITKHWSVATGGIWSKKIYSAQDVEYNGHHADKVDGDCRMWDIPVNVYYNFPSTKAFSFYASLGFSSYLMNEENYVYYVDTPYGSYDYATQVKGENNEWFKTLNISAGMQFRMTPQFSLQFEPTLKAPLAGVGEGEVSLVSLGAFFNLRYEIPINKFRRNED